MKNRHLRAATRGRGRLISFHRIAMTLFCLCVCLGGCKNKLDVVPVSGRLTLDGKPLPGCTVRFTLLNSPEGVENIAATGKTDENGGFTLTTLEVRERKGAPVGECSVMVVFVDDSEEAEPVKRNNPSRPNIPSKARLGGLRFIVPPEGTSQADIDLNSNDREIMEI